jgi:protease I
MGTIAVLIDDYFEDSEYLEPVKALREAGHTIIPVGLQAGKVVVGKRNATKVEIVMAVKNGDVPHFSALLIPGGYSPDKVRADLLAVKFVN